MKVLKFLPNTKLTIISKKSPDDIINLLKSHIVNISSFFEGTISEYKFHIQKRVRPFAYMTRPSDIPTFTVQGNIVNHPLGSEIIIKIKPIMSTWIAGIAVYLFFLYIIIFKGIIYGNNYFFILFLLPVVFFLLITLLLSYYEFDETKINLKKLFI